MNRYVVIGLGTFGSTIATRLYELGHEVIAIDTDPAHVDAVGPTVTRAIVGDGTQHDVVREVGAEGADAGIVAIGENLGASMLALLALRDAGVKAIYVKVTTDDHARIAEALGATDTIFVERHAATNLASRIASTKLLQYTGYGDAFGIQEMSVPQSWVGKRIDALALHDQNVQVVAIHDQLRDTFCVPRPAQVLTASDSVLVAGAPEQLDRLTKVK